MGIIHQSIPQHLALWASEAFAPSTFIETGTNVGDTAIWAAGHFNQVITIEADPHLHEVASRRLKTHPNAEIILGRSQEELPRLLSGRGRSLIWLDAHWSGPGTSGEDNECPILDEIRLVDGSDVEHVLLIDDARLFFNAPPPPHKPDHWPSIGAVVDCLREKHPQSYVSVWRDVVIRIPGDRKDDLESFCRALDLSFHGDAERPGAESSPSDATHDCLVAEVEDLRNRLALAEARSEALLASTSWRITAPIRLIKALGRAR